MLVPAQGPQHSSPARVMGSQWPAAAPRCGKFPAGCRFARLCPSPGLPETHVLSLQLGKMKGHPQGSAGLPFNHRQLGASLPHGPGSRQQSPSHGLKSASRKPDVDAAGAAEDLLPSAGLKAGFLSMQVALLAPLQVSALCLPGSPLC